MFRLPRLLLLPLVCAGLAYDLAVPEPAPASILSHPRIAALWPLALEFYPAADVPGLEIMEGVPLSSPSYDGEYREGDILLRSSWRDWERSYLLALLTHEAGHVVGLPHSSDPNSPMYPGVNVDAIPAAVELREIEDDLFVVKGARSRASYDRQRAERQLGQDDRSPGEKATLRVRLRNLDRKIAAKDAKIERLEEQLPP